MEITITKDNCIGWVSRRFPCHGNPTKLVTKQVQRLCKIVPEFTHDPHLQVVPMTPPEIGYYHPNGFKKLLTYETDYFYSDEGKCRVRLCDSWFGFDGSRFEDCTAIAFDIASFGIKQASSARIAKFRRVSNT